MSMDFIANVVKILCLNSMTEHFLNFLKKSNSSKKKLELFLNKKKFSTCEWQEKSCHKQEQNKKTFSHSFSEKELSTN